MEAMAGKTLNAPRTAKLYDEDFLVWTEETARLLRAGRFDALDIEHLAEEIEDMGKSEKHELHTRLRTLIQHLLKWKHQAGNRSTSWRVTINDQRVEIEYVLGESPSLRPTLPQAIAKVYPQAVKGASLETGLAPETFPGTCPFTPQQILNEDFLPD